MTNRMPQNIRLLAGRLRAIFARLSPPPRLQRGLHTDGLPRKASADDFLGRFREIVSDPLNLLIHRDPRAGVVDGRSVYLHNGNVVQATGPMSYYGRFNDILIINRGVHEPAEEFIFQECLKFVGPEPVMLELGSYWAHYSMWMKKCFPQSTVIMVEPDAHHIAVGRHNCAINHFEGEFIQEFVGKGRFTVDHFLASRNLRHLDVLHSDIQGFEMELLDGANDSLRQHNIAYVFVSTHSDHLHRSVAERLLRRGYIIEAAANFESETTSFDGLVFARSPHSASLNLERHLIGRRDIVTSCPSELLAYLSDLYG